MENVHQLALILMKPLDLHVENGSRVHVNAVILLYISGKAQLVLVLDVHKFLLEFRIIDVYF